jgi:secreted trypsin-like serine protease
MIRIFSLSFLIGVSFASPLLVPSFPTIDTNLSEIYREFIIGGRNAEPNEFPYQVGFRDKGALLGFTFCGGSIISDEWLLSAAHCFYERSEDQMQKTEVVIGSTTLFQSNGVLEGLSATVHPQYHPNTSQHVDLALIKVNGGGLIVKNDTWFTQAIKLNDNKANTKSGSKATVSGYGTAFEALPLPNLFMKTTDIELQSDDVCKQVYEGEFNDNDLCAGDPTGKTGACFGDSGGPLVVGEGNNRIQVGVVSRGLKCTGADTPKIYANVFSMLPWIREVTGLKF